MVASRRNRVVGLDTAAAWSACGPDGPLTGALTVRSEPMNLWSIDENRPQPHPATDTSALGVSSKDRYRSVTSPSSKAASRDHSWIFRSGTTTSRRCRP
jgi:hypothetical protein